jgi:hypothetical protein
MDEHSSSAEHFSEEKHALFKRHLAEFKDNLAAYRQALDYHIRQVAEVEYVMQVSDSAPENQDLLEELAQERRELDMVWQNLKRELAELQSEFDKLH